MKNKKLILAMVFLANGLFAMDGRDDIDRRILNKKILLEKMFDRVGQLKVTELLARLERNLPSTMHSNPALEEFQELGNEAQNKFGIIELHRLPIRKAILSGDALAEATSEAIYVDEQKMTKFSEVVQRYAFFHEAAHVAHRDSVSGPIIFFIAGSPTALVGALSLSILGVGAGLLVGGLSGWYFLKKYHDYAERRADVEALRATRCATCVNNFATAVTGDRGIYLSHAAIRKIAEELKGQACASHHIPFQKWHTKNT